jgi:hypothetical protein
LVTRLVLEAGGGDPAPGRGTNHGDFTAGYGRLSNVVVSVPSREELEAMSAADHDMYEGQLRRIAHRQGLRLTKNTRRGPRRSGCGDYYLLRVEQPGDPHGRFLLTSEYGVNLIGIHRALLEHQTTC